MRRSSAFALVLLLGTAGWRRPTAQNFQPYTTTE